MTRATRQSPALLTSGDKVFFPCGQPDRLNRLCWKGLKQSCFVKEDERMNAILHRVIDRSPQRRRHAVSKPGVICEALEERAMLSGMGAAMGEMGRGSRTAEMSWIGAGRQHGMYGGGSLGLGGGMSNPILLLTAPLLEAGSSSTTPPSRSVLSSSAVQTALQTLQSDLNNDITVGSQPTHASVGSLEDTMEAIHKGTLSGTAAQTQIQSDQAAILSSMGLTQAQITQIQSDVTAVQTAISSSSSSTSTTSTTITNASTTSNASTSTSGSTSTSTTASSTSSSGTASAVQTAMQTLQTDLQNDTPSGAQPTYASIGAVEDDLDAIQKGTLTGTAAVTQVQTDTAAVLSSMGLTATQITQIQTDQQAVQTAMEANLPSSTTTTPTPTTSSTSTSSTSSTATIAEVESTMQSVSAYLIGIPGVSSIGMPVMGGGGSGGGIGGGFGGFGGGGFGGGFGSGPRGGF